MKVVDILKIQIDVKKAHLHQLERLQDTMELGHALLEKTSRMAQMALLSSSSKIDGSLAEKSGVVMKVDRSKELLQEVEKLDAEINGRMCKLSEILEENSLSQELISSALSKYVEINMELQDARKELINVFFGMDFKHAVIGIKMMGKLDEKPFQDACRRKYVTEDEDGSKLRAAMLISHWQKEVQNPSWHPFRIVEDGNGKTRQVVDEDDAKLRGLQDEYGEEVHDAVKTAVAEMNEHNASGGYPVRELWNFGKGRKATVEEGLRELVRQLKPKKRRLN
ncbi:unnamed protein product [Urochloa humidicola]